MRQLATLCYVRRHGRTLMLHRIKKSGDVHFGKWNGLGGKLEPGETPEEGVVREVWEESGLKVVRPVWKGFLTFPGFAEEEDWYVFVFEATRFSGRLKEGPEGHLAWIKDDQVLKLPLWEGDRYFLRWLRSRHFFSGKLVYRRNKLVTHEVRFHATRSR